MHQGPENRLLENFGDPVREFNSDPWAMRLVLLRQSALPRRREAVKRFLEELRVAQPSRDLGER